MINNNPYNIPDKMPLSQSKIISETNSSRHSSTYLQNRNRGEVMYSSSIFLKNPSANGVCEQSFFQPIKQPLSPHHAKYSKNPSTVQFIPNYNLSTMRPPENPFFPVSVPKENSLEKSMIELRQKIERIEKRLEAKERKQMNSNHVQSKKPQNFLEKDSLTSLTEDSLNNGNGLRQLMNMMVEQTLEVQNNKIWQKIVQLEENTAFSLNNQFAQKLSMLEDSFFRFQSEKPQDEHLLNRLKTIEKTIRQMGEDIHLVNDKQETLSAKIDTDLPMIKNQIKTLKGIQKKVIQTEKKAMQTEKKVTQIERKMLQMKGEIDELNKKLKSVQTSTQKTLLAKIKEVESKLQFLKSHQKQIKPSFERYLSEPCILKYIQKYQVSKPYIGHSYSSSTKQESCEQIMINEITYFIDHEGYLLDNDRYYLTNAVKNERIRLEMKHIEMLRERKILI